MINKKQQMGCVKQNDCANYGIECPQCFAMADIYNQHPCYKDKDLVAVVRCKNCKMEDECRVTQWLGENGYCSYGERR